MSPKSLLISGAKNEPSGHGEVLLLKWQKDQQDGPCQCRTRYTVLESRLNAKSNQKDQPKGKTNKATTKPNKDKKQTNKKHKTANFFFCPSPLPFSGSTVLSLTHGPAGN